VVDQAVEVLPFDRPSLLEPDRGKRGEFLGGKTVELEVAPSATQLDLISASRDLHGLVRKLPCDLLELTPGRGKAPGFSHLGRHPYPYRHIQIGSAHPDSVLVRLEEDVGQHRERGLRRDAGRHRGQTVVEVLPGDREFHGASQAWGIRAFSTGLILQFSM